MPNERPNKPTEEFLTDEEQELVTRLLPKILNTPLNISLAPNQMIERVHDDHEGEFTGRLQMMMTVDGDMWIHTTDPETGSGLIRFRGIGGGSMSDRVHNALRILAQAILLDNLARPIEYPEGKKVG